MARPLALERMLQSLADQSAHPTELLIVDASNDDLTLRLVDRFKPLFQSCQLIWQRATNLGAAIQRSEGVAAARQPFIVFCDDDVRFEPECVARLWKAIADDEKLGGVNATITNQQYHNPGIVSRLMFTLMNGRPQKSFAGRVIGPAINLLPEDQDDLPEIVPVEWLNLGCTIYRREALPSPPFERFFTGYSFMEDVALSVRVAQRGWKLANVRIARIFHDSQSAQGLNDTAERAAMELRNRYYVMTNVLHRKRFVDHLRFVIWQLFSVVSSCASAAGRKRLPSILAGKWQGFRQLRN